MGVEATGPISATPDPRQVTEPLEKAVRSGASWFYWIAALSVVNSVIQLSGSDRSFVIGLGMTQVFDAVATGASQGSEGGAGTVLRAIALALDLTVAGFFALIILALSQDPRPPGVKKLRGGEHLYRIRVGEYRIVYSVDDEDLLVLVVRIAPRGEVFRRRVR